MSEPNDLYELNDPHDLVSIIVVAHAYPDWLRECLDSIAAQTHRHFECIVVLDNDPQGELARESRARFADDPRFRFECMPRRMERNHCRNHAINLACGNWLTIVDGDDFLPPDSLKIRLAATVKHPKDTMFGRVRLWSDGRPGDQLIYQDRYVFKDLRIAWPSHCTLLIERQLLGKVRYPEQADDGEQAAELLAGEDVHFLNLLLQANPGMQLVNCHENVYCYRRYPSTSHRLRHRAYFRVIRTILDFHGYPDPADRKYRNALTEKAIYCLLHLALSLDRQGRLSAIDDEAEPVTLGIAAWGNSDILRNCMSRLQSDIDYEGLGVPFEPEPIRNAVLRAIANGRSRNWTQAIPGYAAPFEPQPIAADYQRVRRFRNRHAGETCVVLCSNSLAGRDFLAQLEAPVHASIALGLFDTESCPAPRAVDYLVSHLAPQMPWDDDNEKRPISFLIDHGGVTPVRQDPLTFHLPGVAGQSGDQAFSTDITQRIGASNDLVYAALQIAHYLGFKRTILVGLDPLEHCPDTEWARREARLWQARQVIASTGRDVFDSEQDGPSVAFPKWPLATTPVDRPATDITYFPSFGSDDDLNFSLLRAAWYLGTIAGARIRIFGRSLPAGLDCLDCYDPACARLYEELREGGRLVSEPTPSEGEMLEILRSSDVVICWKDQAYVEDVYGEVVRKELQGAGIRVFTMGAGERLESSMYVEVSSQLESQRSALIATHKARFARLRARLAGRSKAFLVATGPSSKSWERFHLEGEDAVTLVCNSVINDDRLMTVLEPDIVVFADPIFHFGCSTYARAFRARLLEMARRHRFSMVIPFKYLALFTAHMPELAHRVIAVPHTTDMDINLDPGADFRLRTTDNVLTFLMIPLAASLARNLYVIGCDGRPLAQNDYFWNHNDRAQFTGEMSAIRKAHPSFFQIDYNDYYLRHCETLERYAQAVEQGGGGLYSMWQSHIPALRSRLRLPAPVRSGRIIVSINPDLRDEFGHWLHYDRRLAQTTGDLFVSMASIDLAVNPPDLLAMPVFTHPMRETRVDLSGHKATKVGEEFRAAIESLLCELPKTTVVHAMIYTGDLSYVEALEPVFTSLGGRAVLSANLFFTFLDYYAGSREFVHHKDRYQRMLSAEYLAPRPWLRLYSDAERMVGILRQHFDAKVSLWPTVNLDVVNEIIERIGPKPKQAGKRIVFPGNGQLSKGFDLACDFIEKHGAALAESHGCRFVLRDMARDRPEVNEELSHRLAQVAPLPWVEVRSGTLSAEEFLALFWHADLIVLPYRRRHFYARTSSCVVNAVLSGTPTLVPRDTWLSQEVLKFHAGGVFADGDIDELYTALRGLLDNGSANTDVEAAAVAYDIRGLLPALTGGDPEYDLSTAQQDNS